MRQPTRIASIPLEIQELTGITDAMVAGKVINPDDVAAFISPGTEQAREPIFICHNAEFDAAFLISHWPELFRGKPFACSHTQIDWRAEKYLEGSKLSYLLTKAGLFTGFHDALEDCRAVAALLAMQLPSGMTGLQVLLATARRTTHRIYAEGAPYACKDDLRHRGYRWSSGFNGRPRAWFIDVPIHASDKELTYLTTNVLSAGTSPKLHAITAYNRFSGDLSS